MAYDPDIGIDLVANNVDGKIVSLNQLKSDEASEMLVIWLAPSGEKKTIESLQRPTQNEYWP